jgi:ribose 5-phosphate isomerase B
VRILFVCSGNTCRSPMAAALARARGADALSAGLGARVGGRAAPEAIRLFPELEGHRTRPVDAGAAAAADLIVAMTPALAAALRARFPEAAGRVVAWDVPDPAGAGPEAYEDAARRLDLLVDRLAAKGWRPVRVALGADHAGFLLKEQVKGWLDELGAAHDDLGTDGERSVDYPDFAAAVAEAVRSGRADVGILVCGSGIGMSMAANKLPGIRAAVCRDVYDAHVTRNDNDANVLCLGGRVTGPGLAREIVREFLATPFAGGRHASRLEKIRAIEIGLGSR